MINNKFRGTIGKKMRITIQRDYKFLEYELLLEDII
jgi:hypothetical protein